MLAATPVTAVEFSAGGAMTIIVPLNCTAPALVQRMAGAQFLTILALVAAQAVRDILRDMGD